MKKTTTQKTKTRSNTDPTNTPEVNLWPRKGLKQFSCLIKNFMLLWHLVLVFLSIKHIVKTYKANTSLKMLNGTPYGLNKSRRHFDMIPNMNYLPFSHSLLCAFLAINSYWVGKNGQWDLFGFLILFSLMSSSQHE